MSVQDTQHFSIAHPVQDVFAVATNESIVRSVIPGAEGDLAQLFGAKQSTTDPEQAMVVFTSKTGQNTTVSFVGGPDNTTSCSVAGIEYNPKVALYAEIIKNYFVGLALADYVRKQRQFMMFGRGITYSFLAALVIWALWLVLGNTPPDASFSEQILPIVRVLGVGVLVAAPLAAIIPMLFMWPIVELLKAFVFNKPLKAALEHLKRQAPGASVSQCTHAQLKHNIPTLIESVKYLGSYRYRGIFAVIDGVSTRLNKIMNFSGESRSRTSYKYGVLDMAPYRLVQLNARSVAWILTLHSDYAHTYIERKRAFSRSLGGEAIALEGDFAKYFTVYVAKGEQVEALRLASPEVMAAMVDHALPFDLEVRKRTLILHTELKQFLDPIWIARSLTAAQRVSHEIDTRGDAPQLHRPLLSAYGVPLLESQPKLTLLYSVPSLIMFMGVVFESQNNEDALAMPLLIPLGIVLGLLTGYLLAMMVLMVLSFWHNRFSASIAGIVDTGLEA